MDTILVGLEHSLNDEVIQDLTKLFKAVVRNVWIQTSSVKSNYILPNLKISFSKIIFYNLILFLYILGQL